MISHLRGRLAHMDLSGPAIELDVAGVGYDVLVPLVLWPEIEALRGEDDAEAEVAFYIFYHASANQPVPVLVGFLRRAERDFFRKFTTVEGIGPAKAVKAMNVSVSTIARAIEQEDRATLTRLPGIGARGADKIIATLRGKVIAEAAMADGGIERPVDLSRASKSHVVADSVESLTALGYPRVDARRWVQEALDDDPALATSVEELTLSVLRRRAQ